MPRKARTEATLPQQPRSQAARRSVSRLHVLAAASLILVAGLLAYSNSFSGVFVLDEQSAIVDNPNIRSLATAFSAPPEVGLGGRPIASLSFALNYALAPAAGRDAFSPPPPGYPSEAHDLFRANLWGYHAVNLAIHLGSGLLVFGILRRTLAGTRLAPRFGPSATPLALSVSLLWVLHPLNTNAVTYVAQRVESLMGLFFLLTFYCSIRAREAGQRAMGWTAAAIASCLLGAGTKEVIVVAPLLVMAYDWLFPFDGQKTRVPHERRWLYAGLFASWVLVLALVLAFPRSASVGVAHENWTPLRYLATQAGIIVHYLRLSVMPWPLVFDYEWPPTTALWEILLPGALLTTLLALTVVGLWRRRPVAFVGAWFFLILAPSSSVLPIITEVAAEHRMYLPLCGLLTLAVAGAYRLLIRTTTPPRAGTIVLIASLLPSALFGYLTYARNADYHSYERLWADTVAKRPDNPRARSNYATALLDSGRVSEAETHLKAAIAIRPNFPEAQANYGAVLCSQGRLEEGIVHFRKAIALTPDYLDAHRNMAEALLHLGRESESLEAYKKVIALSPDDAPALARAALLLVTASEDGVRDAVTAVRYADRAVQITQGRDPAAVASLAAALAEAGRFSEAVAAGERAVTLAREAGSVEMLREFEARLQAYRSGLTLRQAAR